ncbi:hypothetical protein BDF19DRAFT_454251 [Syncephalis fuscata]|nr:hypothetical protein BDF19DRAFT_454251 [Syncephalis fuscata]
MHHPIYRNHGRPLQQGMFIANCQPFTKLSKVSIQNSLSPRDNTSHPVRPSLSAANTHSGSISSIDEILEEHEATRPPMSAKTKDILDREINLIYEDFISPSSRNEINITFECRRDLTNAYRQNRLTLKDFELARYEILQLIFQNTWPRMLRWYFH